MQVPLISVIVPVYNVENYLRQCLDSIIRQTYQHLEIILIDDASTDTSTAICQEYVNKDKRIRMIRVPSNLGVSNSRNLGLENMTGEFVIFVDSDDYLNTDMIEQLYQLAITEQADIVLGDYYRFIEENGSFLIHNYEDFYETLSFEDYLDRVFTGATDNYITVWGKLFKSSLFQKDYPIRFPSLQHSNEEQQVTHLLFLKSEKTVYLSYAGYCWRKRLNSLTSSTINLKHVADDLDGFEKRYFDLLLAGYDLSKAIQFYKTRILNYKQTLEEQQLTNNPVYQRIIQHLTLLNN
ncbi:TPA: glycosyltransferase family 2 protein [Streptococcus suis]|nr:glycosyltransferase family 2 protein [Streptococcus suis]